VTEPLTAAGMTVAVILTMGLVSRPNGGGKSWAENKDDAVALVRAIEEEAAKLVETSLAIDARLIAAATPRRGTASETIRSALKGARGLALDSGEADLDAELGRAIDLLDGLTALATPTPDTLDVERLVRAEHLWCVQVEGACHKPEAHRKQAEFILADLDATREELP